MQYIRTEKGIEKITDEEYAIIFPVITEEPTEEVE